MARLLGVAIGALGGYFLHRQFPKTGNKVAEQVLLWTDITHMPEPETARKMGSYISSVVGGGAAGILGFTIADKTDSRSR